MWYLNPAYPLEILRLVSGIEDIHRLKNGLLVSSSSLSKVTKYILCNKVFYVKEYFARGKKLRRFFGRSRARAEWENINFCQKLKINVPKVLAYGEKYRWLGLQFKQSVMITEEVPNTLDLKKVALHARHLLKNKKWRLAIMNQLASYLTRLHAHNFLHYDLQWRNILVTTSLKNPQVYLFDIPCGRIHKYFFKKKIRRDFFNLYKSAVLFLSKTDQLRFYFLYKANKHLTLEDKDFIRKLIAYYENKEISQ